MIELNLNKFGADQLEGIFDDPFAFHFLSSIGFPDVEYYDAFVISKAARIDKFDFKDYELFKIGKLFGDDVLVCKNTGIIYRFNVDDLQEVNSSISKLVYCVIEYISFLNTHKGAADQKTFNDLNNLYYYILELDEIIMESDNFWNVFLKDILDVIQSEI